MYNRQLETFLKVSDTGSFSAAAEGLFVTPSAVIQQINALETELEVKLFERSRRGVRHTRAGAYLYDEAIDYIRRGSDIQKKLKTLDDSNPVIRVGTSPDYKVRLLFDLWTVYLGLGNRCEIQLCNFDYEGRLFPETDIVECVRSRQKWQSHANFIKICELPLDISISKHHPLAEHKQLSIEDIKPYRLLYAPHILPVEGDEFITRLRSAGICCEPVDDYSANVIWTVGHDNSMLLVPGCYGELLFDMVTLPLDSSYSVEYGFATHVQPPRYVVNFIAFIKGMLNDEKINLNSVGLNTR